MYNNNDLNQGLENNGNLKLIGYNWDKENKAIPDEQNTKTLSINELVSLDKTNDNHNLTVKSLPFQKLDVDINHPSESQSKDSSGS